MINIAIVEDNSKLADSLAQKITYYEELHLCFIAHNGLDASNKLDAASPEALPDVILMDIEMPVMDGIEATAHIKNHYPQIKILVLTIFDNDEKIFKATMAGASGYFLKDEKINRIVEGIDELMNGGAPMSRLIATKTLALLRNTSNSQTENTASTEDFNLTKREVEILECIAKGLPSKEIASSCFISLSTVKRHIENIYAKLHISSRAEAVKIVMNNRWVQ